MTNKERNERSIETFKDIYKFAHDFALKCSAAVFEGTHSLEKVAQAERAIKCAEEARKVYVAALAASN